MKAITIKQPWASLIVHGIKDIENRTWSCPKKYLGQRLLIHSSGKPLNYDNFYDSILTNEQLLALPENKEWKDFSFCTGSIIGSVEIIDCVQNHPSIWAEKGVYNWVLANPILYENPIKDVKGKLSFWDYPGIKEVKIECPECGSIEIAVEDYTTAPFPTYLHRCNKCEHVIIESEWKEVKRLKVHPDIVSDFTNMPFLNESFKLVVFDPPHLLNVGKESWLAKKYGKLPEDWPRVIKKGIDECFRVLENYGVLIFKWNEDQITVKEVLKAIGRQPLFGHTTGRHGKTMWMCFMKLPINE